MALNKPANAQTTASESSLKQTPADKPDWKAGMGREQVTATRMPLSRTENPVAQFGAKPGMGTVQVTSTKCDLSRNPNMPYSPTSKTTPDTPLKK